MGEPMQADGKGGSGGDKTGAGREGGGESGGGAYADKDQVKTSPGSFKGGQSDTGYRGPSDPDADGENANAGAEGA